MHLSILQKEKKIWKTRIGERGERLRQEGVQRKRGKKEREIETQSKEKEQKKIPRQID